MESRRDKAYSFSYCLFAYIYKDLHERKNLPVIIDYAVPSTKLFQSEIGECVLKICRVHETYLNPVFSKIFPSICTSEVYFFEYVRWYYDKVACAFSVEYHNLYVKEFVENAAGPFFIKFLTLCSFIAVLVLYCFNKKCYSFTSSAPTSLAEIILSLPEVGDYFCSVTNTFVSLNRFCVTVMNDAAINLCDLYVQQSDILQENCSFSLLKNYLPEILPVSLKVPKGLKDDEDCPSRQSSKRKSDVTDSERCCKLSNAGSDNCIMESLKSDSPPKEKRWCPHCGEECLTYLVVFVDDFKITNYEEND